MEEEIPQRVDQFLDLLAMWTIEMFHIEGRPMEFGEDRTGGRHEESEVHSIKPTARRLQHGAKV